MSDSNFTFELYQQTKENHKVIDNHPFVQLMKTNLEAGNLYIDFNKHCIHEIQKHNLLPIYLMQNLFRQCKTSSYSVSDSMNTLLYRCRKFPLEHAYMMYLGLLSGGSILKKYISEEHHSFLTFNNPKETSKDFKNYLNNLPNVNKKKFIEIVNDSYFLIKTIFDEYYTDADANADADNNFI